MTIDPRRISGTRDARDRGERPPVSERGVVRGGSEVYRIGGLFVPEFERLAKRHGKVRVLFDLTGLRGWDAGAAWEDLKFGVHHFADIERLAMVGDKTWQHGMAIFCKPFTKATVRYFDHSAAIEARTWLAESQERPAR
jgi:SpoIIAA-like